MDGEKALQRYGRQLIIEGFGEEGQERLRAAQVVIAGAGGLGSVISIYLAVAGVGKIRIIDHDIVELSNLNRQVLYGDSDIGGKKAQVAERKLRALNPEIVVEAVTETITDGNAFQLLGGFDAIVDAMDNLPTRYILNSVAVGQGVPLFHGAVRGFEGRATTIIPGITPCLKCIYPRAPQPEVTPVIGVAPAVIGSIEATEVIKYIVGIGELLTNRLLVYDGLNMEFMEIRLERHHDCGVCGHLAGSQR
ncbi:MAG: HesA/MoeB/ThiF family protein [Chloroflexi bacterium]|nr:HesA/MoeB/ThiF family protein [Chloroflexota bacterium]